MLHSLSPLDTMGRRSRSARELVDSMAAAGWTVTTTADQAAAPAGSRRVRQTRAGVSAVAAYTDTGRVVAMVTGAPSSVAALIELHDRVMAPPGGWAAGSRVQAHRIFFA